MSYLKKMNVPEGQHIGDLQEGKNIEYKGKKISYKDSTFIVKGKKITIISDTVLCDSCYNLATDADLLICEASFTSAHEDKAEEYNHMTAKQAAMIASQSNVKKLILTHFSPRYKDINEIKEDAEDVFKNVELAKILKLKESPGPPSTHYPSAPMFKEYLVNPKYELFVGGQENIITKIHEALVYPERPLYLGQSDDLV